MTLTELKEQILGQMSKEISTATAYANLETLTHIYIGLCQSETLCKCPMREDENQEFPTDIH